MAARNPRSAPAKAAPRSRAGSAESTPVAPVLDSTGKKSKDLTLEAAVFAVEIKPHLVHETVRAELNARRAGTHAAKTRGFVAGGRAKPWRQKGTGRARAGHDPRPAVHRRRRCVPADPAQLRRQGEQEGAPRRACAPPCPRTPAAARSGSSPTTCSKARPRARRPSCSAHGARTYPLLVIAEDEQENVDQVVPQPARRLRRLVRRDRGGRARLGPIRPRDRERAQRLEGRAK